MLGYRCEQLHPEMRVFNTLLAVLIQMQLRFLSMEQGLITLGLRPRGQGQLGVIQLAQIGLCLWGIRALM